MTNGEKIRAMTDEELSEGMMSLVELSEKINFCQNLPECDVLLDTEDGIPPEKCQNCMLLWLRKEAEAK